MNQLVTMPLTQLPENHAHMLWFDQFWSNHNILLWFLRSVIDRMFPFSESGTHRDRELRDRGAPYIAEAAVGFLALMV